MKPLYIALLLSFGLSLSAQHLQQSYKFRLYLKDKGKTEFNASEPEKFLSRQSIDRKKRQQVKIDATDFPISPDYFNLIINAGGKVVSYSKWFKTITVQLNDSSQIDHMLKLAFVDSARYVWRGAEHNPTAYRSTGRPRLDMVDCRQEIGTNSWLGITEEQFTLHNAKSMMSSGFTGKGIKIAIIDAGFTNADVIPQFGNVNITGYKSFVPEGDLFASSDHGTKVFSTMAANLPNVMIGSAPAATYYLLRSEDPLSEYPVEEDYWVRAAEYADSIGVDLINTSLGYTDFDDKSLSYTHETLDGKTSFMSMAVDKAFEKGILVVTSAGNEGNKKWRKISTPADAKNALTVGAVGADSVIAIFSSRGFTADRRVKPDVVSVGKGAATIGFNGLTGFTNGTSFSSPFMAGLVASLWSVNPAMNREEVLDIVKHSSDRYSHPDSVYGYGIPDFRKAVKEVLSGLKVYEKSVQDEYFSVSRLSGDHFSITLKEPDFTPDAYQVNLLDESGNLVSKHEFVEDAMTVFIPQEIKKNNVFVHLVFKSPYAQKTLRFKL